MQIRNFYKENIEFMKFRFKYQKWLVIKDYLELGLLLVLNIILFVKLITK